MIIDQGKIIQIIESWLTKIVPQKIIYATPIDESRPKISENNRIIIPITGNLWLNIKNKDQIETIATKRGDIIYSPQHGFTESFYKECFSSLAIVFFPNFIRFVYYIYDEAKTFPLSAPDIYYHTTKPIFMSGRHLISAMNELSLFPEDNRLGDVEIARALIMFSLTILKTDASEIQGKASSTWQSIVQYINENCGTPISRSSVAEHFQLSACYLSVICRRFTSKNFNNYLMELRLERAAMLLVESNLLLDEISSRCGFRYTSYFIRMFKRFYKNSPAKYRAEWHK
jgi:AraC-like DNA-binding protein